MKSILISVRPEWIAKILNGEKTIEIRKTMPECKLPIKVYIYCTAGNKFCVYNLNTCKYELMNEKRYRKTFGFDINRQVVAEFTLNKITKHEKNYIDVEDNLCYNFLSEDVKNAGFVNSEMDDWKELQGLLDFDKFVENYGQGKPLYAWHIDDLKIYDEPKELSDFLTQGYRNYDDWLYGEYNGTQSYNDYLEGWVLRKAPLSWCYVEELK